MTTIATWNVNSVKARLENVRTWLADSAPDIALLQEIKCETPAFPAEPFEDLGYNIAVAGQKGYNGVAILSKRPLEVTVDALPGDPDDAQARYLEADIGTLRIACLYLPNGNPPGNGTASEKYRYKLAWMDRLRERAADLLVEDHTVIWGGDFNVIPEPVDCHDPAAWEGDALFRPETRRSFRSLLNLGLTEAFRAVNRNRNAYTFWDYQGGAWQMDKGIRIDHFLLSPQAADRLQDCRIDREPRGLPKASDHVPVVLTIDGE